MIFPALLLMVACSAKTELYYPEKEAVQISLPVASLSGSGASSRAAVDGWDATTVSLAYRQDPQTVYANNVNVVMQSDQDQIIHMGMQYPLDGSEFYVRGYYPAAAPDATGIVRYDISKGDVDVMSSDEVHGNQGAPIIASDANKLLFKHKLARLTVKMMCAPGATYPEWISALFVTGNAGQPYLPTQAELDLSDGSVSFRAPGTIMAGYKSGGFAVPAYGTTAAVIDAMVKPGSALGIQLLSTGDNVTDISLAGSTLAFLETNVGGEAGKQYIINLSFSSTTILIDRIEIVDWGVGGTMPNPPTGGDQWW